MQSVAGTLEVSFVCEIRAVGLSFLPFRRQGRNSSIRRIHDERRSPGRYTLRLVLGQPDCIVVVNVLFRLTQLFTSLFFTLRCEEGPRQRVDTFSRQKLG